MHSDLLDLKHRFSECGLRTFVVFLLLLYDLGVVQSTPQFASQLSSSLSGARGPSSARARRSSPVLYCRSEALRQDPAPNRSIIDLFLFGQ